MVWGNSSAIDGSTPHSVFDTAQGFTGVWHMSDATSGTNVNSAQANYNAVPQAMSATIPSARGVIAKADSFRNGNNYISTGNPQIGQRITVSAWVNPVTYAQWSKVIAKGLPTFVEPYIVFTLESVNAAPAPFRFKIAFSPNDTLCAPGVTPLPLNTWTFLVGTYDGTKIQYFVNGMLESTKNHFGSAAIPVNSQPVSIGGWNQQAGEAFKGSIDEARLSRNTWSADFIKLCYENQRPGSTTVTFK
jgi:hypothetical protein